jgi:norsolorinic acid ketoreductase
MSTKSSNRIRNFLSLSNTETDNTTIPKTTPQSATMSVNTTYLITGVTRGIGLGLLKVYLSRPNHTIIAGIRDPGTGSSAINGLPKAAGTKLIIVKIDSTSEKDAFTAVSSLQAEHNIASIDAVIANAGLGTDWSPVLQTTPKALREHYEVNTIGPLTLFQATWPLLEKSKSPKYVLMASGLSSFTLAEHIPIPCAGYAASKAAITFLARKIHFEHKSLTSIILYPGWVQTELGDGIARAAGAVGAEITIDQSVAGIVKQVDEATREKTSGKFINEKGEGVPW